MPNMLDYLVWRGDLTFAQDAVNEVDALIFSELSYVAFGSFVPGQDNPGQTVNLADAATALLSFDPDGETIHQTSYLWKENRRLLEALTKSQRFSVVRLSRGVDIVSAEDGKQFAAITIEPGDGTTVISYRGTDDTIIGWKEDLQMALNGPIPAQLEAARYLQLVAETTDGPLVLIGHSKGGNLAVYAAANVPAPVQSRIHAVISHDGPGQNSATVSSDGYAAIRDRLSLYIPYFSIVGMLMEQEDTYSIVQSDAKNVLQHDAFSWQVCGKWLLRAEKPSQTSLSANRVIRSWIATLDKEHQRLFIEALSEVAEAIYGDTITEPDTSWPSSALAVFNAIRKLEPDTRTAFDRVLSELFSAVVKSIPFPWRREDQVEEPAKA